MTKLPNKLYHVHRKAMTRGRANDERRTPGKRLGARNVDGRFYVQLEEGESDNSDGDKWSVHGICSTVSDKA